MSNVSLYVVDLKRVQPFAMATTSRVTTVVHTGSEPKSLNSDEFRPGQVIRRSFVKDQNGARASPDVKISEEQSDKSGTDPEDSEENFSQPEITDFRHYEEIFRPRRQELNRTPTQDEEEEMFQAPDCSEPESLTPIEAPPVPVALRPAHLKVKKSSKKPSPSPTRRSSQPAGPSYSGSPVRIRKGSNPTTPTSAGVRPNFGDPQASPTR